MRTTEAEVRSASFPVWLREARTKCTFLWLHSHRSWSGVNQVHQGVVLAGLQCETASISWLWSNSHWYSHETTLLTDSDWPRIVSPQPFTVLYNPIHLLILGGPLLPPGSISWVSLESFIHNQTARQGKQTGTWRQHHADHYLQPIHLVWAE